MWMYAVRKVRRPHCRWGLFRLRPASRWMYLWAAREVILLISSWRYLSGFFGSLESRGVPVSTLNLLIAPLVSLARKSVKSPDFRFSCHPVMCTQSSVFCPPSLVFCLAPCSYFQPKTMLLTWKVNKDKRGKRTVSCVKIGKIPAKNQSKTMVPESKNWNFWNFFSLPSHSELRKSQIEIQGHFSYQTRRLL